MRNCIQFLSLVVLVLVLVGCSGDAESKATDQERANIDRFVKEGIREGDMGNSQSKPPEIPEGQPGNQPVDAP